MQYFNHLVCGAVWVSSLLLPVCLSAGDGAGNLQDDASQELDGHTEAEMGRCSDI